MTEPVRHASSLQDRALSAASVAQAWLDSPPMHALFAAFGSDPFSATEPEAEEWLHLNEEVPAWVEALAAGDQLPGSPAADVAVLDALELALRLERPASRLFNFRGDGVHYKERSQAGHGTFNSSVRDEVVKLAEQLDLVLPARPRQMSYDKTLVLGGGYRSPLLRARYAAQLESEGIDLGDIYLLGSPRFLIEEPPEAPAVVDYAPHATDEYDLMIAGAVAELGFTSSTGEFLCGCHAVDRVCPAWAFAATPHAFDTPPAFTHERAMRLTDSQRRRTGVALSAHTSRPPIRPDTTDTFDLWARFARPRPEERVLAVTTQVFVPFQRFDSLRRLYLELGVEVDAVGYGAEWGDRPLTAEYLLQETLSGIRSARRMLVAAAEISLSTPR